MITPIKLLDTMIYLAGIEAGASLLLHDDLILKDINQKIISEDTPTFEEIDLNLEYGIKYKDLVNKCYEKIKTDDESENLEALKQGLYWVLNDHNYDRAAQALILTS